MAYDDTIRSSADSPRVGPQTLALASFGVTGAIAAVAAVAGLSAVLLDESWAQSLDTAAQNCADCASPRQTVSPQLPELPSLGLSVDDMRLLIGSYPEGRSFRIVDRAGLDLATLGGEEAFLEAYDYVVARTGASLERRITLWINLRDTSYCPARGMAQWSPTLPGVQLYLTESSDRTEALGILAHEIGHIVQALGYPSGGMSRDEGFDQGFATWAAGRYWIDMLGFGSFAEAAASYRAAGKYLPLEALPAGAFPSASEANAAALDATASAACLEKRDIWFTSWAAFIDHLVERFGRERLLALLQTTAGASADASPVGLDFEMVYGATLETLEADWLRAIDSRYVDTPPAAGTPVQ